MFLSSFLNKKRSMDVTDTITEKGIWVKFGIIPIYVRPLTFAQVTEISELLRRPSEAITTECVHHANGSTIRKSIPSSFTGIMS